MIGTLGRYRDGIVAALKRIDAAEGSQFASVNGWGVDLRRRLLEFATRGKLIRGSLVAAACEAFEGRVDDDVYQTAAALELIQSFLLIHDDIMDQDRIRRGVPTVYEQYRRHGEKNGFHDSSRFGESMGICAGDVAVLVAVAAVAGLARNATITSSLISLLAREIAAVGVAQMADVANGHAPDAATEEEIVAVYRFKTGRYTFSLPLMLGAILASAQAPVVEAISRWGELQGVIFQVRDDQLGIMGDVADIGKPTGSDIRSNKQTLHRLLLLERVRGTEWEDVANLFGSPELSDAQIKRVRTALVETGTIAELDRRIGELRDAAARELEVLSISDPARSIFRAIDEYNATRSA